VEIYRTINAIGTVSRQQTYSMGQHIVGRRRTLHLDANLASASSTVS
jgi:hypothetical protein